MNKKVKTKREKSEYEAKKTKKQQTLADITGEYETQRVQSDRRIIWEWPLRLENKEVHCMLFSPRIQPRRPMMTQAAESRDRRGL